MKGILNASVFAEVANPFKVEWEKYKELPMEAVDRLKERAWEENSDWIIEQLNKRQADWIMVIGGKVVKWSSDPDDFPYHKDLIKIAEEKNLLPFVFSHPPLIEESIWNETKYHNDNYPTLNINVDGKLELIGDFDTGSFNTFLNKDQIISLGSPEDRVGPTIPAYHLNEPFEFSRYQAHIIIYDEYGNKKEMDIGCCCIKDWANSPFCKVNENRKALVGRNILLKFPLIIKLDGIKKKSYIYFK